MLYDDHHRHTTRDRIVDAAVYRWEAARRKAAEMAGERPAAPQPDLVAKPVVSPAPEADAAPVRH